MEDLLKYWPVMIGFLGIAGWLGNILVMRRDVNSNKDAVKLLFEKKADKEDLRRIETKQDGMDDWSRSHENKSNDIRLAIGERFSGIEQSIKIGNTNHTQLIQIVGRLEKSLEKLEEKFEGYTQRIEAAILRLGNK